MAKNGRSILDDCERTVTVALPTAASPGIISGDLGTSATLYAFSTVYELPLTRFEIRQTNKHADMNDHYTPRFALRPREVNIGTETSTHLVLHICYLSITVLNKLL